MSERTIETLGEKLDKVIEMHSNTAKKMDHLTILVVGNRDITDSDKGIVGRLEKLQETQEVHKRYVGWIFGAAFVIGVIIPIFLEWVRKKI